MSRRTKTEWARSPGRLPLGVTLLAFACATFRTAQSPEAASRHIASHSALDAWNGKLLKTVSTIGNITGIAVIDGNVYSAGDITTKLLIKFGIEK